MDPSEKIFISKFTEQEMTKYLENTGFSIIRVEHDYYKDEYEEDKNLYFFCRK